MTSAERRAHEAGVIVEHVSRRKVLRDNDGLCGICGHKVGRRWTLDHIIPLSKGGDHTYENVQPAHAECNRMKADLLPWEFVPIGFSYKGRKQPYRNRPRGLNR